MLEINRNSLIKGNTALKPEYEENFKENKKRKIKNKQNKNVQKKLRTLRNIVFIFIIGTIMIGRYCIIYTMQKSLNNVKNEIVTLNKENENLRVELVKYSNIDSIEKVATQKLNMVQPNKSDVIYCDLNRDNFKKTKNKKDNVHKNILDKIKKILFSRG